MVDPQAANLVDGGSVASDDSALEDARQDVVIGLAGSTGQFSDQVGFEPECDLLEGQSWVMLPAADARTAGDVPEEPRIAAADAGGQSTLSPPGTSNFGYSITDRLTVSLFGRWPTDSFFSGLLDVLRAKAFELNEDRNASRVVRFRGSTFEVVSWKGVQVGPKGKGTPFAFVLRRGGVLIYLKDKADGLGLVPLVQLDLGSNFLTSCSGDGSAALGLVLAYFVDGLGFEMQTAVPGRWDLAADVAVPMHEFSSALIGGQVVCRARRREGEINQAATFNGRVNLTPNSFEGFTLGKGTVVCRIYDKLRELKKDPEKQEAMRVMYWGGKVPKCVTRVEFQLRRDALKRLEVRTVADMATKAAAVLEYLTTRWLSIKARAVDRTNTTRAKVSDMWETVRDVFKSFGCSQAFVVAPVVAEDGEVVQAVIGNGEAVPVAPRVKAQGLLNQVRGCIISAAGLMFENVRPSEVDRCLTKILEDAFCGWSPADVAALVSERGSLDAQRGGLSGEWSEQQAPWERTVLQKQFRWSAPAWG